VKKIIGRQGVCGKQNRGVIRESFTGKNLTCYGGTGKIRRFFGRHGLIQELERTLKVEGRRESVYSPGQMVLSMLYGLFLGHSRPNQMCGALGLDRVFQKLAGLAEFPVQSTVSRFLTGLRAAFAREVQRCNVNLLWRMRDGFLSFDVLTLDVDSHVMPVYGNQQGAGHGYNPKKKGRKSYQPFLCFIGETRDYIAGQLRNGKHSTFYGATAFLKRVLKRLPRHLRKVRVRADSGFFSSKILDLLTSKGAEYYVVAPMKQWVQRAIYGIKTWRAIGDGYEVAESTLTMMKVDYRMVVVRKRVLKDRRPRRQLSLLHDDDGHLYDYNAIVTNSVRLPENVWRFYNQRACCENFIKEGIYSFGLDKVVSHSFSGNKAFFEIVMMAYNLFNVFKEEALGQITQKQTAQTIRDRILRIPGKLVTSARQPIIKLPQDWPYRREYEQALTA